MHYTTIQVKGLDISHYIKHKTLTISVFGFITAL